VESTADRDLLKAAAAGDESAFTLLFRRYQDAVYRFAWRLTGSASTAEDLTQECFIRVLKSAPSFDPDRGSLRTYLYATARNLAITHAQRNRPGEPQSEPDSQGSPEDRLLENEASAIVRRAIDMLPEAQREALVLIQYEELTLEEAARVLEIDIGAVKSRLHRGRENLKQTLAPYFGTRNNEPIAR
jgi:RNA polymerase sigma-70 factor (ECF subfamily)